MKNICLLIKYVSKNKVCLKSCRKGLCEKTKSAI